MKNPQYGANLSLEVELIQLAVLADERPEQLSIRRPIPALFIALKLPFPAKSSLALCHFADELA